jgi:ELWxxDGT repeat protein
VGTTILALGNNQAIFEGTNEAIGLGAWITDGTPEGTRLLKDVAPDTIPAGPFATAALGDGGALLLAASPDTGREPWASDGTGAGTRLLADINPGPGGSDPFEFVPVNGPAPNIVLL